MTGPLKKLLRKLRKLFVGEVGHDKSKTQPFSSSFLATAGLEFLRFLPLRAFILQIPCVSHRLKLHPR